MAKAAAAASTRAREYETIYVLRPDLDKASAEKVAARVEDVVGKGKGKLTLVESWGRRRLAYPVQKHTRGTYVYLKYLGGGPVVQELERHLRMLDGVLKYQTVKLRDDVDAAAVTVNPDDVKFEAVEVPDEPEADDSMERQLGLDDPGFGSRSAERHAAAEGAEEGKAGEAQAAATEGESAAAEAPPAEAAPAEAAPAEAASAEPASDESSSEEKKQ